MLGVRSVACRIDLNIDMKPKYGVFLFDSIILIVWPFLSHYGFHATRTFEHHYFQKYALQIKSLYLKLDLNFVKGRRINTLVTKRFKVPLGIYGDIFSTSKSLLNS